MNEQYATSPTQTSSETQMDEFGVPIKNSVIGSQSKQKIKPVHLIIGLMILAIGIIAAILIVFRAISQTNTIPTVIATPSAMPTVQTPIPTATPTSQLPPDWQKAQEDLTGFQSQIQQPNEDRAKLSIPNLNLNTELKD